MKTGSVPMEKKEMNEYKETQNTEQSLWRVMFKVDYEEFETNGTEIIKEFIYQGKEEEIIKFEERFGRNFEETRHGVMFTYITHEKYEFPEVKTTFPEDWLQNKE